MADNHSTNMPISGVFESTSAVATNIAPTGFVKSPINQEIYLWFTVVFFVIGLCGNKTVILAFILFKKLRSRGSVFIVNTAVADICVAIFGDLFMIIGIATNGEFLLNNPSLCVLASFLCSSVCSVAIWSIAAASFNGYVRVCHHRAYSKIYTPVTVTLMLVAIWTAGILIFLPTVFGWGSHVYVPIIMYCIVNALAATSFTYFGMFTSIGMPLVVIFYAYTRIILTVRASRRNLNKDGKGVNKSELHLIRSVLVIGLYFVAAFGFLAVINLMGASYPGNPVSIVVAVVLAHTHCAFTGILYAMTNKRYREACRKMFYFCWHRGTVGAELTTTTMSGSGVSGVPSSVRTVSGVVTSVTNTSCSDLFVDVVIDQTYFG